MHTIVHDTHTNTGVTGQHLLHIVAACWNVPVASFLVSHGADIHCTDTSGRTPLHIAASTDHMAMIEYLLEQGADIDSCTLTEKQTAIHHAARSDSLQALQMLIEHGGMHSPYSTNAVSSLYVCMCAPDKKVWGRDYAVPTYIPQVLYPCIPHQSSPHVLPNLVPNPGTMLFTGGSIDF